MTWFRVDDAFHSHPKVLATSPAALGLWVIAGAWSSANLTEGFIPIAVLPRLLPDAEELAAGLVVAGLWRKRKAGYQFHDWTDFNPTREEALKSRAKSSSGGTLGNHRRWHVAKNVFKPDCPFCDAPTSRNTYQAPDRPPDRGSDALPESVPESPPNPPTRPDTDTPPTPPKGGPTSRRRPRETSVRRNGLNPEPAHTTEDGQPFAPGTGIMTGPPELPDDPTVPDWDRLRDIVRHPQQER